MNKIGLNVSRANSTTVTIRIRLSTYHKLISAYEKANTSANSLNDYCRRILEDYSERKR